ncbi:DUF3363 domain-containing protein [Candidatus Jidaibacter acanthamoebae]|nr:DUF3363 domain-containing protein [Candidatus Jidaibacter acanthamoeba]
MSKNEEQNIELNAKIQKRDKDADFAYLGVKKLGDVIDTVSNNGFTESTNKGWFAKSNARGNSAIVDFTPKLQNSTVIVRYSENKTNGLWRAHGNYLARENSQKDNEKGLGFNNESNTVNIANCLDSWQKANDPRIWKIIISPELGDKLDLKEHTKLFISKLEQDLDTSLSWVAIDHYNTDNPHVHLLIRGIDIEGKKLDINPAYLKQGMRLRSKEVATQQLGYRTEAHASLVRERQIASERFTSLDSAILKRSTETDGYKVFSLETRIPNSDSAKEYRLHLIRRLKKLEELGAVMKLSGNAWRLEPDFKEILGDRGKLSAGLKILDRKRDKMSTPNQDLAYTILKNEGDGIIGRVLGAGLDPDTDKPYLLLEAIDGKAHYITQADRVHAGRLQSDLVEGCFVKLEVKTFESSKKDLVKYINVKDYGHTKVIPNKLIDDYLVDTLKSGNNLIKEPKEEGGFAAEFYAQLNERTEFLKTQEVILNSGENLHPNWKENLDKANVSEVTKDKVVKEWNHERKEQTIVGRIIYCSQASALIEDYKDNIYKVNLTELNTKRLEVGSEICIQSNISIGQDISRTDLNLIDIINKQGYYSQQHYNEELKLQKQNAEREQQKFFLQSEKDIERFTLAHSRRADTWVRLGLLEKNELKQYCLADKDIILTEDIMKEKLNALSEQKTKEVQYHKFDQEFITKESNSQNFTKLDKILISLKDNADIQEAVKDFASAKVLVERNELWNLRDINLLSKEGEQNARSWLEKHGTIELIKALSDKPIEILSTTSPDETKSYVGEILSIATEDKQQNKYLVIDVGREIKALPITQNPQMLKVGQQVNLRVINNRWQAVKHELNKSLDLSR